MLVKRNSFFPTFPNIFNDFFDKEFSDWTSSNFSPTQTTLPAVNVKESDDNFVVTMAAPGMEKKDFKINLENNLLTISSEKENDKVEEKGKYTRKEYSYQSFTRSFGLPQDIVDSGKITAKYENGELQIVIPKKEEAKPLPPKSIEVK